MRPVQILSILLAVHLTHDLIEQLQAIFREVFDDDDLVLTEATDRETLEAWDSLGHIRLVAAMEDALELSFTLEDIERMTSVAQILAIVTARR